MRQAKKKKKKYLELPEHKGRVFAVGDIHGCLDETERLLKHVDKTAEPGEDDLVVFIGDYVDRGPESKQVIEFLMAYGEESSANVIFLKGNHEDMFLNFLGYDGTLGEGYLINGGLECLESYGIDEPKNRDELLQIIPDTHLEFLHSLERYVIVNDYIFAHAGLNPLRDLKFQLDDDLYWIRDEFIANIHYFKKTIVFGHTPFQDVLFHLPYKIGIDTGLVYGSALTCIELTEEQVFQIERKEKKVRTSSFKDKGGEWPEIK